MVRCSSVKRRSVFMIFWLNGLFTEHWKGFSNWVFFFYFGPNKQDLLNTVRQTIMWETQNQVCLLLQCNYKRCVYWVLHLKCDFVSFVLRVIFWHIISQWLFIQMFCFTAVQRGADKVKHLLQIQTFFLLWFGEDKKLLLSHFVLRWFELRSCRSGWKKQIWM